MNYKKNQIVWCDSFGYCFVYEVLFSVNSLRVMPLGKLNLVDVSLDDVRPLTDEEKGL